MKLTTYCSRLPDYLLDRLRLRSLKERRPMQAILKDALVAYLKLPIEQKEEKEPGG